MNLDQMFPARFVRGQDLTAAILATITGITRDETHPRPGVTEEKYVLHFERIDPRTGEYIQMPANQRDEHGYATILRKTLAEQIAGALSTRDTDQWIGQKIVLMPTRTRAAGRDVLTISARAPKAAPGQQPQQRKPDTDAGADHADIDDTDDDKDFQN